MQDFIRRVFFFVDGDVNCFVVQELVLPEFVDFLYNLTLNKNGESLSRLEDNFNMYVLIAKEAQNSLPRKIIQHFIFNEYRIKKKSFPKKSFYTL